MPTYDQSKCLLAMRTTLEGSPAILTELEGEDRLSACFVYRIRFATEAPAAAVKALIGTAVTLFFGAPDADAPDIARRRPLNGHIRRLSRVGRAHHGSDMLEWRAEVVPRLWFLSQTSDFRIFHDLTIPQIVSQVLTEHGVVHADRTVVPEAYGTLEYCVQYDETALDFVSRLLEHAGIFYWHEHTDVAHTLCFTDNNNNVRIPHPDYGTLVAGQDGVLESFDEHYSFRTGAWTVRDHNLTRPQRAWDKTETFADVASADAAVVDQFTRFQRYRYPGNYMARLRASGDGSAEGQIGQHDADLMATRLIEVEESNWERWSGAGALPALDAGTKVSIDPSTGSGAADYVVTGIRHEVRDHTNWSSEEWALRHDGGDDVPAPKLSSSFDAAPHAVPFRPDRVTRKPRVAGPQTALVVGPPGQEINTDEFGRVQVQFLWDRAPASAAPAGAVWIRVSQGWAGAGWGQMYVPRVGQEVIVDFLNGDPDRPIVTGRVYDTDNPVPYTLPAHATQSGIRTRSTPGGTAENYNELRFEDAKGAEQVLLHAERDYLVEVENNETRTVGIGAGTGDRSATIKRNETVAIGGDKTVTIGGNHFETIDGGELRSVTGSVTETIGVNMTTTATGWVTITSESYMKLNASTEIDLTAPTVNVNATTHNRFTKEYDWQMGVGAGSFYGTTNFQAGLSTNAYGLAVTVTGVSLTMNGFSASKDIFESKQAQISQERREMRLRNSLLSIEKDVTALADRSLMIEQAVLHLLK